MLALGPQPVGIFGLNLSLLGDAQCKRYYIHGYVNEYGVGAVGRWHHGRSRSIQSYNAAGHANDHTAGKVRIWT
jgi:hypothetical protein